MRRELLDLLKLIFSLWYPPSTAAVAVFLASSRMAAAAMPQPDLTIAYDVNTFGGTAEAMADGRFSIMHGDGGTGVFALRLEQPDTGATLRGFVRSPLEFDDEELVAAEVMPLDQEYGDSIEGQAEAAYHRLLGALRHHRPPTEVSIDSSGRAQVANNERARRYDRCGTELMRANIDQALMTAENDRDRQHWRRTRSRIPALLHPQTREARILLRLFSVSFVPAPNGAWIRQARRNLAEPANGRRNQFDWRHEQTVAQGEEFVAEADFGASAGTALGRICRELRPRRLPNIIRDRCEISAVFDRRDGWPLVIGIGRVQETRNRSRSNSGMIFSRLAPLEGFVPPPNPCPAA